MLTLPKFSKPVALQIADLIISRIPLTLERKQKPKIRESLAFKTQNKKKKMAQLFRDILCTYLQGKKKHSQVYPEKKSCTVQQLKSFAQEYKNTSRLNTQDQLSFLSSLG